MRCSALPHAGSTSFPQATGHPCRGAPGVSSWHMAVRPLPPRGQAPCFPHTGCVPHTVLARARTFFRVLCLVGSDHWCPEGVSGRIESLLFKSTAAFFFLWFSSPDGESCGHGFASKPQGSGSPHKIEAPSQMRRTLMYECVTVGSWQPPEKSCAGPGVAVVFSTWVRAEAQGAWRLPSASRVPQGLVVYPELRHGGTAHTTARTEHR